MEEYSPMTSGFSTDRRGVRRRRRHPGNTRLSLANIHNAVISLANILSTRLSLLVNSLNIVFSLARKTPGHYSPPSDVTGGYYPCEYCGKPFKNRALLAGHVHQVHTKIKTCKLCKEHTTDLAKHREEFHPETVIHPEQVNNNNNIYP